MAKLLFVPPAVVLLGGVLGALLGLGIHGHPPTWAVVGACIGIVALLPMRSYRVSALDPSLLSELSDTALSRTWQLVIPGHRHPYNPSLVPHDGGYLLSFRVKHHSLPTYLRKVLNVRTSYIGLIKLDANLGVCGVPQILSVRSYSENKSHSAQDARLMLFNGKVYVFFNDYGMPGQRSSSALFMGVLIEWADGFRLEGRAKQLIYARMGTTEKNWVPFVANGAIHLIYSGDPHCILRPDLESGRCEEVAQSRVVTNWHWGDIRGGTPACRVGSDYLTFFHSSIVLPADTLFGKRPGRSYAMGAYRFEASAPFAIRSISPPLGSRELYLNNRRKVVFPSGMAVQDNRIHVAWGKNDEGVFISTFDTRALMDSMRTLTRHD